MLFWSGERLFEEAPSQRIIDPFDPNKIDCSAYTLRLGPEAFVTPDYDLPARDNLKKALAAPFEIDLGGGRRNIAGGELVIPSGQFAILLTEEFVRIPPDAMGFISLKFGIKGTGLINVSGFHVDPGYAGRLIFAVYNAGPSPFHITRGQDMFLLWLADLDRTSRLPYIKSEPKNARVNIPEDMISRADRPIHSLHQLSDKIAELDKELTIFRRLVTIIASILLALVALTGLGFTAFKAFESAAPANGLTSNVT